MADNFLTKDRGDNNVDLAAKETAAGKLTPRSILTKADGVTDVNPATEEKQDAGNASLASLVAALADPATETTLADVKTAAEAIAADPATATLQTSIATLLSAIGALLTSLDGKTTAVNTGAIAGTVALDSTALAAIADAATPATQPVSAASLPLPTGAATEATLAAQSAKLPAALGSTGDSGSLSVAQSTEGKAAIGSLTETAPTTDTASSGLNGRLQRIAQRITSLIALLPSSLGIKTAANSLSIAPASDGVFRVSSPITARSSSALTITLASLAQSGTLTVGRCSSAYDNTTNVDEFLSLAAQITTGTSPTASKTIEVWAFAEIADGVWPDLFSSAYSGADGGFTVRSREILFGGARLIAAINTGSSGNTSDVPYTFAATDIAALLGGVVRKFAVFVTQDTGVSLNATGGNHSVNVKPHYRA